MSYNKMSIICMVITIACMAAVMAIDFYSIQSLRRTNQELYIRLNYCLLDRFEEAHKK